MQIVSLGDNFHEMSKPISGEKKQKKPKKNKKNITNVSSAEFTHSVLSLNTECLRKYGLFLCKYSKPSTRTPQ